MKKRYFLLPILLISLMIFVLDNEREVINKEVMVNNTSINYPFFNDDKIDNYINEYLNEYRKADNTLIDYDYYNDKDIYYLTFYKYIIHDNMLYDDNDSFVIDLNKSSIEKTSSKFCDYDFVINRKKDKGDKLIALTFDDGPNYNTNKIINILNKYNVKATFFVLGSRIKGNEYILKKAHDSGMEIGNHSYSHLLLTRYKEDKIKKEIEETSTLIYNAIGTYPKLFRPGYGSVNKKIKKISNMPIIIWDIDTLDWKYHNSKRIASRVINKVRDGDIVLMHDIYSATSNAIDIIIPELQSRGYTFVTIPELFYYKGVSLENGKVYGFAK